MIIYIVFLESIFSEINMYRKLQGLQKSYNFNNIMKLLNTKITTNDIMCFSEKRTFVDQQLLPNINSLMSFFLS